MISTLPILPTNLWFHGSVKSSSGPACGSPSGFGTTFGTRNLIVEDKPTKVTEPRETEMVSTKKSMYGLVLCNFALPSCWKYSCWPEISQVCFVKYIYPLSEELSQWNRAWQLFLHCSCTGTEWKGQEENNRVNLSPEKSQGNLALQVHFLTLPTPAKTT